MKPAFPRFGRPFGVAAVLVLLAAHYGGPGATRANPTDKRLRVIDEPATVLAIEETPVYARLPGHIHRLHVDIGDRVTGPQTDSSGKQTEPGQALAELRVPEMDAELQQKTALVKQAEAEVDQAEAALKAADAHVDTAAAMIDEAEAARARVQAVYDRWESEFRRVTGLVDRGVIDEQTRDETQNQFKAAAASRQEVEARVLSAKAAARESEAKRNKARADLEAARAHIQVATAEEARVRALADYLTIRAPFDGVIIRRNVHTGHLLTGTGALPLFVVARTDFVRVVVEVPETDAALVRKGTKARVRFPIFKDEEFEATVARVSWGLDPRTRTLRAEIDLPNPKERFRPGMFAQVAFDVEAAE